MFAFSGYDVTDKISEGAFGQVYKATRTETGTLAAVKVSPDIDGHHARNLIVSL